MDSSNYFDISNVIIYISCKESLTMKKEIIKNRVDYWIESAKYDLKTAQAMLKEKRYLYVGFCCHLTCEKVLKAYYWSYKKTEPPFTHNLNMLISMTGLSESITKVNIKFLDELMPLNIKARYPDDKVRISKFLNNSKAKSIYQRTTEFAEWIEKLLTR